jgi:hypothetical protein
MSEQTGDFPHLVECEKKRRASLQKIARLQALVRDMWRGIDDEEIRIRGEMDGVDFTL